MNEEQAQIVLDLESPPVKVSYPILDDAQLKERENAHEKSDSMFDA